MRHRGIQSVVKVFAIVKIVRAVLSDRGRECLTRVKVPIAAGSAVRAYSRKLVAGDVCVGEV